MADFSNAFVNQFNSNVIHLSQQKVAKLSPYCMKKTQKSELEFFDRVDSGDMQPKIGRNSDVVYTDLDWSKRAVSLEPFTKATLIDEEDKVQTLINPESEYVSAFVKAAARQNDDTFIKAALGDVIVGKQGATSNLAFLTAQKMASFDGTSIIGSGLTLKTLIAIQEKFGLDEVEEGECYFAYSPKQKSNMLNISEVTSADYAAVKALVNGEVDTFMGFKFISSNRLPVTAAAVTYNHLNGSVGAGSGTFPAAARRCIVWKKDGMLMTTGISQMSKITQIPEKHYAWQIYLKLMIGAARLEDDKVIEVLVKE